MASRNGFPDMLDTIGFSVNLGGEPFIVTVYFDGSSPSFDASENPIDTLSLSEMNLLIIKLTQIVDMVEKMTAED